VYEDRIHHLKSQYKDTKYYICSKSGCPGRLVVKSNQCEVKKPHRCIPHNRKITQTLLKEQAKSKISSNFNPIPKQFDEILTEVPQSSQIMSVKRTSFLRYLYRKRNAQLPTRPRQINFSLDSSFQNEFLFFDVFEQGVRAVTFLNRSFLPFLESATNISVDGTFFSSPKLFKQIFAMGLFIDDVFYPFCFSFLSTKSKKGYDVFFKHLKQNLPFALDNKTFKVDFERALINSLRENFPSCTISGCYFHFVKCLIRKLKSLSLFRKFCIKKELYTLVSLIKCLAFLPPHLVDGALNVIKPTFLHYYPSANKFISYIFRTWISSNPPSSWNCNTTFFTSNNHIEAYFRKLNSLVQVPHPHFYRAASVLVTELKVYKTRHFMNFVNQPPPVRAMTVTLKQHHQNALNLLQSNELSPIDFLYRMCEVNAKASKIVPYNVLFSFSPQQSSLISMPISAPAETQQQDEVAGNQPAVEVVSNEHPETEEMQVNDNPVVEEDNMQRVEYGVSETETPIHEELVEVGPSSNHEAEDTQTSELVVEVASENEPTNANFQFLANLSSEFLDIEVVPDLNRFHYYYNLLSNKRRKRLLFFLSATIKRSVSDIKQDLNLV